MQIAITVGRIIYTTSTLISILNYISYNVLRTEIQEMERKDFQSLNSQQYFYNIQKNSKFNIRLPIYIGSAGSTGIHIYTAEMSRITTF